MIALLLGACAFATEGMLVERTVRINPRPKTPPVVKLAFVGDMMLARIPGEAIARGVDPFAPFATVLKEADLAIGNLECVIATVGARVPKAYNFRCHPRNVPLLARYFAAVSVANNHSGDYGKDAFAEQLSLLEQGGVKYFGGGRNLQGAHTPLILEHSGMKIAFLGYSEIELRSFEAGLSVPGVAWADDEKVVADITASRALADLVVVYPHWGLEYRALPSERQVNLGRKMIEAGAHLVVGAHPHVTQTVEHYKGGLIVYSLGNFVFDDFMDVSVELNEPSRISWVLRVEVSPGAVLRWNTLVARTDDQGIPRPVPGVKGPCGELLTGQRTSCGGN